MIQLHSTPKLPDGILPRTVAPEVTYQRIQPLMSLVGVTHVIEITNLDHLGIPVCFALGPLDATINLREYARRVLPIPNGILEEMLATVEVFPKASVSPEKAAIFTAGKGLTPLDSRVSAMMEAIERFSARQPTQEPFVGSYREISSQKNEKIIDPASLILLEPDAYDKDQKLEWVIGTDLCSSEEVWIPAEAATLNYHARQAREVCSNTATGLGAGNSIEEAISHGLAEVIEHDAWTVAIARSTFASARRGILENLFGQTVENRIEPEYAFDDIEAPFVPLDLDSLAHISPIANLVSEFQQAKVQLFVYNITSDIEIPVFATSADGLPDRQDGGGLGTHPDARLALIRALTEAAQQRLVSGLKNPLFSKRPIPQWQVLDWERSPASAESWPAQRFEEVNSKINQDVLEDIQCMLHALQMRSLNQSIVVDLTKPELNVPVVKVIVPGSADFWTSDKPPVWGALGSRVRRYMQ